MEPSPLQFVSHTRYYRGGDVFVDASAAIALVGVLWPLPMVSLRLGRGAGVGAGVVIQAKQGCIFVEAGASLGTGVLIVGQGYVGKDACVGPSSTLINPAIAPNTIIPPCSLINPQTPSPGSPSPEAHRQTSNFQASSFQTSNGSPVPSMPIPPRTTPTVQPQSVAPKAVNVPNVDPAGPTPNPPATNGTQPGENSESAISKPNGYVYGRAQVNSLLSALFPHRQPLNNGNTNNNGNTDSHFGEDA